MIGTVETRKVVTIELERSEVINILQGATMEGHIQVRHDKSDVPMDCRVYCSNPDIKDERVIEDDDE